jgi:hypothetical protein
VEQHVRLTASLFDKERYLLKMMTGLKNKTFFMLLKKVLEEYRHFYFIKKEDHLLHLVKKQKSYPKVPCNHCQQDYCLWHQVAIFAQCAMHRGW